MQNTQTSAFSSMFLFFLSYFDTTKRFNKSDKTVNFKCSWSTAAILHYYFFFFYLPTYVLQINDRQER